MPRLKARYGDREEAMSETPNASPHLEGAPGGLPASLGLFTLLLTMAAAFIIACLAS
jgi:hypothetical protein